jgi:hypothetical protein
VSRAFFPLTRPSEVRQSGHDEAGVSQPYDALQRRCCRYGCPRPDLFSNVSALVSDSAHSSIEGCSSKAILRPDPQPGPTCDSRRMRWAAAGEQVGYGSRSAQHCSVNEKAASPGESACCHVAKADARTREEKQMRTGGHRAADALDAPRRPLFGSRAARRSAAAARSAAGAP